MPCVGVSISIFHLRDSVAIADDFPVPISPVKIILTLNGGFVGSVISFFCNSGQDFLLPIKQIFYSKIF
jgi:hypothetical protein